MTAPRRRPVLLAVLALASLGGFRPAGALSIDADFDHGSLLNWSGTPAAVTLNPRTNYYDVVSNNQWRWMYFKADGLDGAQTQFTTSSNFVFNSSSLVNHKMMYSYDNENWEFFDNGQVSGSQYRFSNDTPFTQDEVWVAYAQPYSYGMSAAHTAEVLATPWAEPTASADANGVIGMSPGGVDDIGRTIDPRPLFGYRVTDPSTDSATRPKRRVVISSGMHAGETIGTHTFQGLVDWLVSDDPRAASLRTTTEFFAYPVMNPDGRFAGFARTTVQNPNQDPNGLWNPALWQPHQDIKVTGEAMIADVQATPGDGVDAYIDFHSTVPAFDGEDFGFIEIDQGDNQVDWWVRLKELEPLINEIDSTSTGWISANFAEAFLGADVDVTFENQHGRNRPVEYYHELGENFGVAFYDSWAAPGKLRGDYNADGFVDGADYTLWRDTFLTLGSGLPADGTGGGDYGEPNGFVGQSDYDFWRDHFGLGLPPTAAASTAIVPEPTAAWLLGLAAAAGLGGHRCRGW